MAWPHHGPLVVFLVAMAIFAGGGDWELRHGSIIGNEELVEFQQNICVVMKHVSIFLIAKFNILQNEVLNHEEFQSHSRPVSKFGSPLMELK